MLEEHAHIGHDVQPGQQIAKIKHPTIITQARTYDAFNAGQSYKHKQRIDVQGREKINIIVMQSAVHVCGVPAHALAEICHHGWKLLHSHCGKGSPQEHLLLAWSPQTLESGPASYPNVLACMSSSELQWWIIN